MVFVMPQISNAQQVSFYAIASKSTISVGDKIEIAYIIENADFTDLVTPNWSVHLKFLYGPSRFSNYEVINGKISSKKTFSYLLKATKAGKIKIKGATAIINGKSFKSNDLTINIVEPGEPINNTGPTPKPNNNSNAPPKEDENQSIEEQVKSNIFVRAFVDKTSVFEGQQVVLTFKVFYLIRVEDLQIAKNPSFKNFYSYDMEIDKSIQEQHEEKYNGKLYNCQTFMKVGLFPIKSGDFVIDPIELSCVIPIMIGPAGFKIQDFKEVKIQSEPITIRVKPLGNGIKPDDFCGGIGKFSFIAEFDKDEVKAGEPLNYSVKVRGKGNIKLLNLQKPVFPAEFEVYNPKIKEEINTQTGDVVGMKQFEYLVLPQKAGNYTIPSYSISYFDEEKQDYNRVVFPEKTIKVVGNVNEEGKDDLDEGEKGKKKSSAQKGIEKLFTKQKSGSTSFFGSIGFYVAMVLPILLFLGFLVKNGNKKSNKNINKNASKINDYKELAEAKKHLDQQEEKPFYKAISEAMLGYMTTKTGTTFYVISKEKMMELFAKFELDVDSKNKYIAILEQCEQALFSPLSDKGGMNGLYVEALNLLEHLDEQFKKLENA
jgi:hypothetical protein